MKTKRVAFELEDTVPGTFLLQGFAGGALAGFIFMFLLNLITQQRDVVGFLIATPFLMFLCAIFGAFKASIMYAVNRLTGIPMDVVTRVVATTVGLTLLSILFGRLLNVRAINDLLIGVGFAVAMGLPTALLVGSRVRPWQLFTFGTIAVYRNGFKHRVGSKELPLVVATLPLRFLSAACLAIWILYTACVLPRKNELVADVSAYFLVPLIYLSWSTYVSFRSPRKAVLLFCGLALNIPLALLGYFTITGFPEAQWLSEIPRVPSGLSFAFGVSWLIFLTARMNTRIESFPNMTLNDILKICKSDGEHACLGARFFDWQKRVAL